MNTISKQQDDYREQIIRFTEATAVGKNDLVRRDLPDESAMQFVEMFTDGNLEKRHGKIKDQLDVLEVGYDRLDEFIDRFIREVPLAAYDTGCTDTERFLKWLLVNTPLSRETRDRVTCHRSRNAVEFKAAENRLGHVRFQEISASRNLFLQEWGENLNLWMHLNPIHVEAVFRTRELLDDETELPAAVMFFPVGNNIHTAVLEPAGQDLVHLLDENGPARLAEIVLQTSFEDRWELIATCRELAEMGLAAFG